MTQEVFEGFLRTDATRRAAAASASRVYFFESANLSSESPVGALPETVVILKLVAELS